jgi:3-hydroxyisobutyrate dehydrogenase-like beta-hydroxyacid dehydrogenase
MTNKSPVSVIGLGKMGSALAQALLRVGQQVVVYNRSPARSEPYREQRATVAASLAEAITLSPVSLVSVSDYHAAEALFFAPDDGLSLAGKTIIQLSSGTPQEARAWSARCTELGAQSLTGAILAYPMHIGTPQAQFLISRS